MRILRASTPLSGRPSLWLAAAFVFAVVAWPEDAAAVELLKASAQAAGSALLYGYVPLLALGVFAHNLLRKPVSGEAA